MDRNQKVFCNDTRRNNKGNVTASCSLAPHRDPEHVDMHAGRSWFNMTRAEAERIRTESEQFAQIVQRITGITTFQFSGTGLLIIVGVALETLKQLEAQLTVPQ